MCTTVFIDWLYIRPPVFNSVLSIRGQRCSVTVFHRVLSYPTMFNCVLPYPTEFNPVPPCSVISHYVLACSTVFCRIPLCVLQCSDATFANLVQPRVSIALLPRHTIYHTTIYLRSRQLASLLSWGERERRQLADAKETQFTKANNLFPPRLKTPRLFIWIVEPS